MIVLVAKNTLVQQSKLINKKQSAVVKVVQEGFGSIRNVILDGSSKAYEREFLNADLPMRYASAKVQLIAGIAAFFCRGCRPNLDGGNCRYAGDNY